MSSPVLCTLNCDIADIMAFSLNGIWMHFAVPLDIRSLNALGHSLDSSMERECIRNQHRQR